MRDAPQDEVAGFSVTRVFDDLERHPLSVDEALAGVLEIDRDAMADRGLDLTQAPVGLEGIAHEHARREIIDHPRDRPNRGFPAGAAFYRIARPLLRGEPQGQGRATNGEAMTRVRIEGLIFLLGFGLSIPAANWLIGHVGTVCVPNGPCLIPVAPHIAAPSGVLMIGLALVLRDLVQRRLGLAWSAGAILGGTALSAFLAPPHLVLASAAAFVLSEFADLGIYTPLQRRRLVLAVAASGALGLVVDSAVFLYLAFGDLAFLPGQIIGKAWMVALSLPLIAALRERDARLGIAAA